MVFGLLASGLGPHISAIICRCFKAGGLKGSRFCWLGLELFRLHSLRLGFHGLRRRVQGFILSVVGLIAGVGSFVGIQWIAGRGRRLLWHHSHVMGERYQDVSWNMPWLQYLRVQWG